MTRREEHFPSLSDGVVTSVKLFSVKMVEYVHNYRGDAARIKLSDGTMLLLDGIVEVRRKTNRNLNSNFEFRRVLPLEYGLVINHGLRRYADDNADNKFEY